MGEPMTFTCDVSDKGNPEAEDYSWDISDDRWNCDVDSVNKNVYRCIVFNDGDVIVSCTPSNSLASGRTVTLNVPVIGGTDSSNYYLAKQ